MCVHIDLYVYKDHLLFVLNTYRCRRVLAKSTSRNICLKNSYVQLFSAPGPSNSHPARTSSRPTSIAENGSRRSGRILFN